MRRYAGRLPYPSACGGGGCIAMLIAFTLSVCCCSAFRRSRTIRSLRSLAIVGNGLFILWITYNGINEGFSGTLPEIVSYICLVLLLGLNILLLSRKG